MKIKLFIFIILYLLINIAKSEFSIISTQPEYLLNSDDDLIINTIDGPNDINDIRTFILDGKTSTWVEIGFSMPLVNQFIIDKSLISNVHWGERLFRLLIVSSNTYTNNYAKIGIATPILESITINSTTKNLIANCWYLNNTNYKTYLKGISLNQVEPIEYRPPINNNPIYTFVIEYPYSQVQYIRSYPYLECNNSKSNLYEQAVILPFPQMSSLVWDKIPRKGGLFKYHGFNLYPFTDKNEQAYRFSFFLANTLEPRIECKNYTIIKYYGNQEYDASCIIDSYFEPAPNAINCKSDIPSTTEITLSYLDFYLPPSVESTTSSFYGTPKEITIKGSSFCISPNVTIGGSKCEVRLSDYENDVLYCNFNSDVQGLTDTHTVSVDCFGQVGTADIFIYAVDECALSEDFNGVVCSGNGTCIEDIRKCNCSTGYSGFDCSNSNNGHINPPIIDNTTTIIETNNSRFDIGLVQIREMNINNDIYKSYNLTTSIWNLEQTSNDNNEQLYNTTLDNDSIIRVLLTINSNSEKELIYDFYGDNITLLPLSVKYQIEINSWPFDSTLNTLQLIFQSQLSTEQCDSTVLAGQQRLSMYGDSIRSVELTLVNGQTLVGQYSNRMKVDDRIVKSEIKLLSTNESIGIPSIKSKDQSNDSDKTTSIQNAYTAILISNFNERAIIDPNFGLLVSSDISKVGSCNKKFESWKIALCVVLPVIGVALLIIGISIYRQRNRHIITVNGKQVNLKEINNKA